MTSTTETRTEYLLMFRDEESGNHFEFSSFDRAELDAHFSEYVHFGADPENFTMKHRRVTTTPWELTTKPVII